MTGLRETRTLSNGHRHIEKDIIAYLSYALKDVRKLSPLGAHLLEMSIAVLNDEQVEQQRRGCHLVMPRGGKDSPC
jgi:hypothetical protein